MNKNNARKTVIAKLAALAACAALTAGILGGCGGIDPNVSADTAPQTSYEVVTDDGVQELLEGNHAYFTGKTAPKDVGGVSVDPTYFALRSYELVFLLAQKSFNSVDEIQVDALAQFAFAHLYHENLNESEYAPTLHRSATAEEVSASVEKYFGVNSVDLTQSVLYNSANRVFEMWEPNYGRNVFCTIDAADVSDTRMTVVSSFYNEIERSTLLGHTTVVVENVDGAAVIKSVMTEID